MLYLLFNKKKQANWQVVYESTYTEMLNKEGIPYNIIFDDVLYSITFNKGDFIWVMHYQDLTEHRELLIKCPAKVIFRMSGTSVHPYCYQVDMHNEDDSIQNVIDYNMVFCDRMKEYMESFYPNKKFVATGYPITVLKPTVPYSLEKRNKEILIGGRLSPDKQVMLAMYMLTPLLKDYNITFCYPDNKGKDTFFFEKCYGGFERYKRLGFNFEICDKQQWVNRISQAEFYFSASLGDTSCISEIEAITLGAYPLVPKFNEGLPVYDVYIDVGYEPFSKKSLLELVKTKPEFHIDNNWFSPEKWVKRFKEILDGKFG